MTTDDITEIARRAGGVEEYAGSSDKAFWVFDKSELDLFAKLVAAAERDRIKWDSIHSCHPECDKPVCVAMRKAVADEREACARLLDDLAAKDKLSNYHKVAALLIRERGAP